MVSLFTLEVGLQAQLWSETIHGRDMLEYYMLPRMIGFSESEWTVWLAYQIMLTRFI
jgi:N-acetyl-beta-hexosaminidase